MHSINPADIDTRTRHRYLLGAIGPRPIAFVSTVDENGVHNLAPFSFFNVFSANPPILVFSPARSGRTGNTKDTYNNVKQVPEAVVNIVNYDIVTQMSLASSPFPPEVDEFEKSGLTPIESELVKPMRVKEAPVQFECKVKEVVELGHEGGSGNLVICEVVMMHFKESILDDQQMVDQQKIDLVARMGGNWYCRADKNSMFEIAKPITTIGVGVDSIPEDIRLSPVLSGNDLGHLGNVESLPDETEVNEYKLTELADLFVELEDESAKLEQRLHQIAKEKIAKGNIDAAWKTLLSFNN